MLTNSEWEILNKIILTIGYEEDPHKMRSVFLRQLRRLIVFNLGEFSIGDENRHFFDSVEVNMDDGKQIDILSKYYDYKNVYGNINLDWIFATPDSIALNVRDIIRGAEFEKTKFYSVFLKSINMKYSVTVSISHEGRFLGEFCIYRSEDYPDFDQRDMYILDILKTHIEMRMYSDIKKSYYLTESQHLMLANMGLSEREIDVFRLAASGMSNDRIAEELFISISTVKKHMGNVLGKLGVKNRSYLKDYFDATR
ncbi:MAG: helix-turn-helix transcriptional regulator [Bacillota bacterium]|nr:helix-turn-helix transcriptional regulator [Bacillota bacterium]